MIKINSPDLYETVPVEKFPVRILRFDNPMNFRLHWHEKIELLFFYTSGGEVISAGEVHNIEKNDLIIVNSNELHRSIKKIHSVYMCIMIDPTFFDDSRLKNTIFCNHIRNDKIICDFFDKISKEEEEKNIGFEIAIKGLIYDLFVYLMRNYTKKVLEDNENILRRAKFDKIAKSIEYVEANYNEEITETKIAEMVFMSVWHFSKTFKSATGQGFKEYLNNIRIQKAKEILKNTTVTISEAANMTGFCDSNYFSRKFKEATGKTPKEYRKVNLKNK